MKLMQSQINGLIWLTISLATVALITMCSTKKEPCTTIDTIYVVSREEIKNFLESQDTAILRNSFTKEGKTYVHNDKTHKALLKHEIENNAVLPNLYKFNPNKINAEGLQELGFSEKQANSIIKYRTKIGGFNTPEDFAKSYVVSDYMYKRLKSYIDFNL